ncbi:MAG: hypothetical protein JETT_0886 [Candidatus Jettenia ecosi]|uniref:Uncharacterized protein n=1 Tax=Candidatus Jettenia ecosi TaxID=2494326 RepID=A0A533QDY7_9BACT|nr:MAG: hypothetical protein JETT_0886 [Candidatus Jettenia ecosi]
MADNIAKGATLVNNLITNQGVTPFDPPFDPTLRKNDCAERALRHAVVIRKISHGSRSEEGERAFTAHLTFLETCKKLGCDVKEQLKRALHPSLYPNWSFAFP